MRAFRSHAHFPDIFRWRRSKVRSFKNQKEDLLDACNEMLSSWCTTTQSLHIIYTLSFLWSYCLYQKECCLQYINHVMYIQHQRQSKLRWYNYCFNTFILDNLSRKPSTIVTQSSTYGNHSATLAKDGIKHTTEKYCSHTGLNRTKAWLQVDLGKKYSISYVKIFYRNEGMFSYTLNILLFIKNLIPHMELMADI